METVSSLHLPSWGLLSKWGFNDGDMPDHIWDWLEERIGIDAARDVPWRTVLEALVREHLVPALDQAVEVVTVETCHNPIRATTVDGADVEDFWFQNLAEQPKLTPDGVDVPYEAVLTAVQAAR